MQKKIEVRTSECRDGTPKKQPNEVGMEHDTFTRSLHLSIFQTCYMVFITQQSLQHFDFLFPSIFMDSDSYTSLTDKNTLKC